MKKVSKNPSVMERHTLHVYTGAATRNKLERLAKHHHRTMSSEVQELIDAAYKAAFLSEKGVG